MDRIRAIKEKTTVLDYAQSVLGFPVRRSGDRWRSLDPGSTNPTALVIYTDWWYDFKLGKGGDVIDLCAVARHAGDKGAAIRELGGEDKGWVAYTQKLCKTVQKWHQGLRDEDRRYLASRKIREETVKRLKIGFDGSRLVIPYWKNGYIAYYVTRERDGGGPKYKKAALDGLNENIPWGLHSLESARPLVVTEGAFDALSFEQEGYRVLSPLGGHFSKDALRQVINICQAQAEPVFLCFDSDGAGTRFQAELAKTLFRSRVNFRCGELAEKDVSDYYVGGGDLHALVGSARPGVEVLCQQITDKQEFKAFVFEAARFVEKAEMAQIFDLVDFPKSWLEQVKRQALSAPPEDLIVKEIVKEKRLKYFEALGFYEYTHGVWKSRSDTEIKAVIADAYGHYRTGARVGSALSLLKAEVVSTELFNQQDIFNFRNCVLDLSTGEVKEHSESFMSSVQVDYDYDPDASSPVWRRFLDEVCQGDEARSYLLQEIAGYVLFSDNSLQKCFFLIGDGSNGKSVYLDVLTAIFGRENVSSIEMSGLVESFQRIHLLNSIVNISTETRSDVKGAESVFKQIVVGDAISGCYKNKDFLSFRPRTKLITACNEYIKSRDTTTGFMRRIGFVAFNAKFADEPQDDELKADKDLPAKLRRDLPAIFNWAYTGYKFLRENKTFTVTPDQKEMMEGFMRVTNPLVAFIEEERFTGEMERNLLYNRYVYWCKEAGHQTMSQTKFTQQFKQTAKQVKLKFTERRTPQKRYFTFPETDDFNALVAD